MLHRRNLRYDASSAKVKPLHATLARRALLRLDSMAAPDPTPTTSSALSNLPASSSSSNDFEIGSSHSLARARGVLSSRASAMPTLRSSRYGVLLFGRVSHRSLKISHP